MVHQLVREPAFRSARAAQAEADATAEAGLAANEVQQPVGAPTAPPTAPHTDRVDRFIAAALGIRARVLARRPARDAPAGEEARGEAEEEQVIILDAEAVETIIIDGVEVTNEEEEVVILNVEAEAETEAEEAEAAAEALDRKSVV